MQRSSNVTFWFVKKLFFTFWFFKHFQLFLSISWVPFLHKFDCILWFLDPSFAHIRKTLDLMVIFAEFNVIFISTLNCKIWNFNVYFSDLFNGLPSTFKCIYIQQQSCKAHNTKIRSHVLACQFSNHLHKCFWSKLWHNIFWI